MAPQYQLLRPGRKRQAPAPTPSRAPDAAAVVLEQGERHDQRDRILAIVIDPCQQFLLVAAPIAHLSPLELPADATQDLVFGMHETLAALLNSFVQINVHYLPRDYFEGINQWVETDPCWAVLISDDE